MRSMRPSQKTTHEKTKENYDDASASGSSSENDNDTAHNVNSDSDVHQTVNNATEAAQIGNNVNETDTGHSIAQCDIDNATEHKPSNRNPENNVASSATEGSENARLGENDPLVKDRKNGQGLQTAEQGSSGAVHGLRTAVQGSTQAVGGVLTPVQGLTRAVDGVLTPVQGLTQAVDGVLSAVQGLTQAVDGVLPAVQGLTQTVDGVLTAVQGLTQTVDGVLTAVQGLTRAVDGVLTAVQGLTRAVDGVLTAVQGLTRAVDGVLTAVQEGSMRLSHKTTPGKPTANGEVASKNGIALGCNVNIESDTANNVNNNADVDQTANNETEAAQIVNNETDTGHSTTHFDLVNAIEHQPSNSNVASSAGERNGSAGLGENDPHAEDQDNGHDAHYNQLNQALHGVIIAVQETDDSIDNVSLHNAPNPMPWGGQLHVADHNNPPFPIPGDVDIHDEQDDLLHLGVHLRP